MTRTSIVSLRMSRDERTHGAPDRQPPVLFAVDDDVATVELLCEVARDRGWLAYGFTRLDPLHEALAERSPTLLILDDELPDGRGGDLALRLRRDPETADIPLLVCTAAHPMRQAEIGSWAPVVAKPFDLDEIERFLDAAARRHDGDGHLGQAAG
jgi:DNA-binding response OmpR family regulator